VNKLIVRILLLIALIVTPACSGSGGGSSLCVSFVGLAAPAAPSVSTQSGSSPCGMVVVQFYVTDVDDLFGAAFDVDYDPAEVSYVASSLSTGGSILGSGGATITALADGSTAGKVVVGVSRTNPAMAIDVSGTQLLCSLTFQRVGTTGTSALTFSNERLFDDSMPPLEIPSVGWAGGNFDIM